MSTNEAVIHGNTNDSLIEEPDNAIFPPISQRELAFQDIKDGFLSSHIWLMLAYRDIKIRYRRSVLGPFWITISMAITVYTMGFLYGHLFHVALEQYYPYLVSGMLTWTLISTSIIELTDTFALSDGLLKKIKLPYSLYVHRVIARNFIIFFHNLLVMLPIYFIFREGSAINFNTLLLLPGLALIYLNAFVFGLIFAMIGARFRDISQIIKNFVQVVFFMTPIMWNPAILPPKNQMLVYLNPFYSYIELVRAPLIGATPSLLNVGITLCVTLVGILICTKLFIRYRAHIIYWL
jgi:ABC-type polysaccharide/polyol phosphate export permease